MRKLKLHIGASKTGSSAIQAFMRINRDYFDKQGFCIPDRLLELSDKITGEHVFALESLINNPDKSLLKGAFDYLDRSLKKSKNLLISAENLSNMGRHQNFDGVLDAFDTEVILYIRRQDDLLASAWQQWHSKIESDFNAWLIKGMRQYGHWDRIIQNWESVVGAGNVKVRVFERSSMVEGDLLRDFLDCLGLDPKTDDTQFDVGTVNPSYSDIITPLVAANRSIFEDANDNKFYKMVGDLTGKAYVEKQKVSLLTAEQRESLVFFYRDINQRVCENYFPGRPRLFSPVDHSKYSYITRDELIDRQLQFLTHLIYSSQKD